MGKRGHEARCPRRGKAQRRESVRPERSNRRLRDRRRKTLCDGMYGLSRRTRQTVRGRPCELSASSTTAARRHSIFRARNLLDHQARHPHDSHVRLRPVLQRGPTLVARGFHPPHRQANASRNPSHPAAEALAAEIQ